MNINHAAFAFGASLGLGATVVLFMNVQWYHDLLVWSWTTPWMYAIGIPVGVATAVMLDD